MTEVASTDPVVSEAAIVDNEEDESKVRSPTTTPHTLLIKALLGPQ
jgi:hypothetical protein